MVSVVAGRIMGAMGLMATAMYLALIFFVPETRGISWVGAFGAVGLAAWVYLDWTALSRFFGSRGGREQIVSLVLVLIAIAIGGLLMHIVEQHPKRWDLTEGRIHSLDERTEQILKDVPADLEVTVTGFFDASSYDRVAAAKRAAFKGFVDAARATGTSVTLELLDPALSPRAASRADVTSNATVIISALPRGASEDQERRERLLSPDEEELANALTRVVVGRRPKIYFMAGHGERSPRTTGLGGVSALSRHLQNLGFELGVWASAKEPAVPEDAAVLIIAAPQDPLDEREAGLVREWVEDGGSLALFAEPKLPGDESAVTGLEGALLSWGLRLQEDLVLDQRMALANGDPTALVADEYGFHEITRDFDHSIYFSTARSIQEDNALPEQVTVFELAKTGKRTWGETELDSEEVSFTEADNPGPLTLVALAELHRPDTEASGQVLVAGDVDWITDGLLLDRGNRDFVTRAIGHLAKAEDVVKLLPRGESEERLDLNPLELVLMAFVVAVLVPGVAGLTGIILFFWRRSL
jgi:hypothetical protein